MSFVPQSITPAAWSGSNAPSYLLAEDDGYLLTEDGGLILLFGSSDLIEDSDFIPQGITPSGWTGQSL